MVKGEGSRKVGFFKILNPECGRTMRNLDLLILSLGSHNLILNPYFKL